MSKPPFPADLDHIIFAGPDLSAAVAKFTELTGVVPAPGGKHPTGTENQLVAFTVGGERTKHYLEIIGPAEGNSPADIETFSINERTEPGVATFAIHPADADAVFAKASAAGVQLGELRPLSRRKPDGTLLEWRVSGGPERDTDKAVPFLIDWAETAHPGLSDLPTIELIKLSITHPNPSELKGKYDVLGISLDIAEGPASIAFSVSTSDGRLVEIR